MTGDSTANPTLNLDFRLLHQVGLRETRSLLASLDRAGREDLERRPAPRVWSAEEWARHLAWIEDAVLRVECLGMEPTEFPEGFAILPGQVRELHFDVALTHDAIEQLQAETCDALGLVEQDWLDEVVEDGGGRRVADDLARYLNLTARARGCAHMALRLAQAAREARD